MTIAGAPVFGINGYALPNSDPAYVDLKKLATKFEEAPVIVPAIVPLRRIPTVPASYPMFERLFSEDSSECPLSSYSSSWLGSGRCPQKTTKVDPAYYASFTSWTTTDDVPSLMGSMDNHSDDAGYDAHSDDGEQDVEKKKALEKKKQRYAERRRRQQARKLLSRNAESAPQTEFYTVQPGRAKPLRAGLLKGNTNSETELQKSL